MRTFLFRKNLLKSDSINKLTSVFGGVKVQEVNGYYVFVSEKRSHMKSYCKKEVNKKISKKLLRKNKRLRANETITHR